eukprot:1043424-Pleurochrysis_carterae.AAC.2
MVSVTMLSIGERTQVAVARRMLAGRRAREEGRVAAADEEVDGFVGAVAEAGREDAACRGHPSEVGDDCVRLIHDHTVCIRAPTPQKEGDTPEGATIQEFVPSRRPVAQDLVSARRPEECPLPPLEVCHVRHIADIVRPASLRDSDRSPPTERFRRGCKRARRGARR